MESSHDNTNLTNNKTPWLLISLRLAIGLLFFLSGILKANDPIGLSEKMKEILHSWNIYALDSLSLTTALVIISAEVIIGISLWMSFYKRITITISWFIVGFFAVITGVATFNGAVDTCGCFGDCLPLTTQQSFIKNCILFVLLGVLFFYRNQIVPSRVNKLYTSLVIVFFFLGSLFTSWWALEHLPFLDCSKYKKGTIIESFNSKQIDKFPAFHEVYQMEDIENNDTIEWDGLTFHHWKLNASDDYKWINQDEILDSLAAISPSFFALFSEDLEDYTNIILKDPGYNFLFLLKDTNTASIKHIDEIRELIKTAHKNHIGFYIVSSATAEETNQFIEEHELSDIEVLYINLLTNQHIIRTNPGLIILKSGKVLGKWGFNEYPTEIEWKHDNAIKVK